ncbi:MAG: outer membrane lipoprotein-sorting protein [Candidatus Saccharicenans sp.]|nr:outer membrane lipoprotein-sorting protein [Candidatus Saccharicenans sp.]
MVGEETIRLGEGFKAGKSGPGTSAEKDSGARAAQPAGQAEEAEQRGLEEKKEREAEKEPKAAPSRPQSKISGSVIEEGSEVKCWVLELAARQEDVAYPRRKLWVDRERFVVVRAELYARGGTLLKKVEVLSLRKFGWRWVPVRAIFKDMLKAGEGTEFLIDSIEFEARIPDYIFTRAALK